VLIPRSLLLLGLLFVILLSGCAVSPDVSAEAITLGATLSLAIRRMLTDGTWPQRLRVPDPYKSVLAGLLGAVAATLTAKAQGAAWDPAIAAGLSGLPAILQGVAEALFPVTKSATSPTATSPAAP